MSDTGTRLFTAGSYLQRYFDEKDLPETTFDLITSKGVSHSIPNMVVVEHIAQTEGKERTQIEGILRRLDFKNGDLNHFLKHLARGLAEHY
jgi:hypothetical protein